MNTLQDGTSDLEGELRALLRRRSAELRPDPPDWRDLIERPQAVVVSLPTSGGKGSGREDLRPWRQRPKPVFIAAAVVAVVLAGGVAVNRQAGSDSANLAEAPASFTAAVPGDDDFDARTAPGVYTSDLADPVEAARAYLASAGVGASLPGTPATDPLTVELLDNADGIATVEWSLVEASVTRTGTILLRTSPVEQATSTVESVWSVVGSTVDGIVLADVTYEDGQLAFTVTKTADIAGPLAVSLWSNGEQVAVDGDAVQAGAGSDGDSLAAGAATEDGSATAGAAADRDGADATATADPGIGQIVDIGDESGASVPLTATVADASTAIVRVHQLVDGQPTSITEMAVALPGSDTSADAGAAGSADGGAEVDVDADAGPTTSVPAPLDDVQDTAEDVVDGTRVPLPGGHDVTTPSIPTTLPDVPVPTTLPDLPALPGGEGRP
jgi:hypothetical protein